MNTIRRAVLDIGTNSVKLLVADVAGDAVFPVLEQSRQTRLGRGFYSDHLLRPDAIQRTASAAAFFAGTARQEGAVSLRAVATSAARDARNPEALQEAVLQAAGTRLEILSGEQEAEWAYRGVTTDERLRQHPLLIMDAGGGSTEFIFGERGQVHFRKSCRMGTVRLQEQLTVSDPPSPEEWDNCRAWLRHFIFEQIAPELEPLLERHASSGVRLVGVGGSATVLARMEQGMNDYDRERIETVCLSRSRIKEWAQRLWGMPLEKRRTIPGLPPNRADVILPGVSIYEAVMDFFGTPELYVSTRGLRFAALLEI